MHRAEVHIDQVTDPRLETIFRETVARYIFEKPVTIVLRGTRIKGSTMQAQPIITFSTLFAESSRFRIRLGQYVRHSHSLLVSKLETDVLTGWFAHELGHVHDYHQRSALSMVWYGIRYVLSRKYRRAVEHKADEIAIAQGFYEELMATKQFLFTGDGISPAYRKRLQKYYMSMDDLTAHMKATVMIDPID